ncbi:MAG: sigma-70 family RNA polymerase sigma factor [Nitriliruptoraceae bacterium]|nr:sigma-70 family RNA polymerase sigma factor [Nitriliruptoraceae bacterium]
MTQSGPAGPEIESRDRETGADVGGVFEAEASDTDASAADTAIESDIDAHAAELFHVIRGALHDEELAAEILQDVFVRAWRAHGRYDPTLASRRTWLFAIARNAVVDAVRRRQRRPRPAAAPVAPEVPVEDEARLVADRLSLHAAMRVLSDEHRTALVEVHMHGRTYAEVADELQVPEGTVRSRVFYALRQLRRAMREQGWTHG